LISPTTLLKKIIGADIEARPRQDPGAVQRLGGRNRPALPAHFSHLRHVDGENYQGDRYGRDIGSDKN
jgi:hypothetical protein